MLRLGLAVALCTALTACKRDNPKYCDVAADCDNPEQQTCDPIHHECVAIGAPDAAIECSTTADCVDPGQPICPPGGGTCGDCAMDPQCQDRDPDLPFCVGGNCVECKASTDCDALSVAPVCGDGGACRGCQSNAECAHVEGVCDAGSGKCLGAAELLYVAPGGGSGDCTKDVPCATLSQAEGKLDAGHRVIKVAAGTYGGEVVFDSGDARVVGAGADMTIFSAMNSGVPVVRLQGDGHLRLEQVTVRGAFGSSDADGVRCAGNAPATTSLTLGDAVVELNAADGIDATSCTVTLARAKVRSNSGEGVVVSSGALLAERTQVAKNKKGGLRIDGSDFVVRNCMVTQNGQTGATGSEYGGVRIFGMLPGGVGASRLEHTTVAYNQAKNTALATGVECWAGAVPADSNLVAFNTDVNVALPQVSSAPACAWSYSLVKQAAPPAGMANFDGEPAFVDTVNEDFHVQSNTACKNKGNPASTVTDDYDGEPRPTPSNQPPECGADEIP